MKALFLTTHVNAGGITRYLMTLAKGFARRGHEVIVVSAGGDQENFFGTLGPRVKHLRRNIRTKSELDPRIYLALPSLVRLVRAEKIELIHAQTRVTQVMGVLLGSLTRKPVVTTCHGFFKPRFSRKFFTAWGDAVIAISEPVKEHLEKDFAVPAAAVRFITNGIDLEEFVPVADEEKGIRRLSEELGEEPAVGIIARLSSVKGIDVLIRAMPKVLRKFPQAKLLVIGKGPEEANLRRLTEELILDGHVLFKPVVDRTAHMLSLLDVFVMPSRQEGLGLSVLEAQAMELPVIASNVGGLANIIDDGRTGLLVPPERPDLLAHAIDLLLEHPEKSKEIGRAARREVAERFSSERMVEDTLKVYEELVNAGKSQ